MIQPILAPATSSDVLEAFKNIYGTDKPIPVRILAYTGRIDGKVICVGGIAFYPNGARIAFCDISPEGRRYPLTLHRGAKIVFDRAKKMGIKQVVVADTSDVHEKTPGWLRHLGFVREQGIGGYIFVWRA